MTQFLSDISLCSSAGIIPRLCRPCADYQYLHGDHSEPGGGVGTIQICQDCTQLHLRLCQYQRAGINKIGLYLVLLSFCFCQLSVLCCGLVLYGSTQT